jgi:hypothetical protein
MSNAERAAKTWSDREFAKKFVENLGTDDRIVVDRPGDPETTYTLHRPPAEPEPIFMSGDCAAVREAIGSGWLELTGEVTYKKRNPGV